MADGILHGLHVVEGSAFVAIPLGGMTLAQLGADVIRFDPLGGGLDARRWPLDRSGNSLFWAGLNKGKRSIAVDPPPRGRELLTALMPPRRRRRIFTTNMPARGWLAYEELARKRADLIALNIVGARDGSAHVDYTVNAITGFPMVTGPSNHEGRSTPWRRRGISRPPMAARWRSWRRAASPAHGQGRGSCCPCRTWRSPRRQPWATSARPSNEVDRPRFGNEIFGTFGRDFKPATAAS
jgi:2-methylfumaryl-CoA isomerase